MDNFFITCAFITLLHTIKAHMSDSGLSKRNASFVFRGLSTGRCSNIDEDKRGFNVYRFLNFFGWHNCTPKLGRIYFFSCFLPSVLLGITTIKNRRIFIILFIMFSCKFKKLHMSRNGFILYN